MMLCLSSLSHQACALVWAYIIVHNDVTQHPAWLMGEPNYLKCICEIRTPKRIAKGHRSLIN